MVRLDGIEPTTPAWKAEVLPLNYSRLRGCEGFTAAAGGQAFVCCGASRPGWPMDRLGRRNAVLRFAGPRKNEVAQEGQRRIRLGASWHSSRTPPRRHSHRRGQRSLRPGRPISVPLKHYPGSARTRGRQRTTSCRWVNSPYSPSRLPRSSPPGSRLCSALKRCRSRRTIRCSVSSYARCALTSRPAIPFPPRSRSFRGRSTRCLSRWWRRAKPPARSRRSSPRWRAISNRR